MKMLQIIFLIFFISIPSFADVYIVKAEDRVFSADGIIPIDKTEIQLVSEIVLIDLYEDSSKVECTFELKNFGDSINVRIGFPKMYQDDFFKERIFSKNMHDFIQKIQVNNLEISEDKIILPTKSDAWFIWPQFFEKGEKKTIKLIYHLPSGKLQDYRYFEYYLHTGSTWKGHIEKADVIVKIHDIPWQYIEWLKPSRYIIDKEKNTISWQFSNFKPNEGSDIYIKYYNLDEKWGIWRYVYPVYWWRKIFW